MKSTTAIERQRQAYTLSKFILKRGLSQTSHQLLCLCIVVCSAVASGLGFFSSRVTHALDHDIANYLGAPMVIRSSNSIQVVGLDEVLSVMTVSFTTGATAGKRYQSVSFKAVGNEYPIQSKLIIDKSGFEIETTGAQLTAGQAWLSDNAMRELGVSVGDTFQIGKATFVVDARLVFEPDRLTQLQHTLPRVLVSMEGMQRSGIEVNNQSGEYRLLLSGTSKQLSKIEERLKGNSEYQVLTPNKGQHPFSRLSERAQRMMSVIVILTLLLCGGAASILTDYIAGRFAPTVALVRSLGITKQVVNLSLVMQLLVLVCFASLIGTTIGWLVQPSLSGILQPHMTLTGAKFEAQHLFFPMLISVLAVAVFVVPKLIGLNRVSVMTILRDGQQPLSGQVVTAFIASAVVLILLWYTSDNVRLTSYLAGGLALLVLSASALGWLFTKLAAQTHHAFRGATKLGIRSIGRSTRRLSVPLIGIAIVVMAMLLTAMLRQGFLQTLQVHILEQDGNYLFAGLPMPQKHEFESNLNSLGMELKGIYPVIRAQLTQINGQSLDDSLTSESETREEARSKVRLTWASKLPDNNELLAGDWPRVGKHEVSVEAEVMQDLGLEVGDELGFDINGTLLTARISSQRKYKPGGSRMMFWFMFPEQVLERYDVTMMGGMLLRSQSGEKHIFGELLEQFPTLRITDLESQISGIRSMMLVLTRLFNLAVFILLIGALTIVAALSLANSSRRTRLLTLIRAFGAKRGLCLRIGLAEQLVVAAIGCLIGVICVHAIGSAMFHGVFGLEYSLDWKLVTGLTIFICAVFALFAYMATSLELRKSVNLGIKNESLNN